ncbi:MAG TPA: hypothetical protein VLB85_14750 [Acidimicrobiia bacterium]|nr:hypothetical protein [Acidimicrobiia bacterium]
MAAGYGPEDAERFLEMATMPTPILASPDGTAFADVSWFWDSPSIRIRSLLEDGSLVETLRLWDHSPGLPQALQSFRQNLELYREMTRASTPDRGRSIQVVPDAGPAEMWQAHQRHLTSTHNLFLATLVAYILTALVLGIFVGVSYGTVPMLATGAVAVLGYVPIARWVLTRLRYLPESLRPRFTR